MDRATKLGRYPLDEWSDGSLWGAYRGRDYQVETRSFRAYLYEYARTHRLVVHTYMVDRETIRFQFTQPGKGGQVGPNRTPRQTKSTTSDDLMG